MELTGIPPGQTYYFARDDRVYRAFVDRLDKHKTEIHEKLSRRLKWQFRVLRKVLDGRTTAYHVSISFFLN